MPIDVEHESCAGPRPARAPRRADGNASVQQRPTRRRDLILRPASRFRAVAESRPLFSSGNVARPDAGGKGGIRTPDTVARMPHFECGAIDHSATFPRGAMSETVPSVQTVLGVPGGNSVGRNEGGGGGLPAGDLRQGRPGAEPDRRRGVGRPLTGVPSVDRTGGRDPASPSKGCQRACARVVGARRRDVRVGPTNARQRASYRPTVGRAVSRRLGRPSG